MRCNELFLAALTVIVTPSFSLFAQDANSPSDNPCRGTSVISVPSRPTVTSATDTTPCGVAELEYGLEREWPGGGANRDDLTGGLRFGLTPNLDFHWSSSDFVHLMDAQGDRTGFGETWLGLRYRFLKQGKRRPSLGVFYAVKDPTGNVALGIGSGKVDHSLSFLASKDLGKFHFDFNLIELFAGRPASAGFDHDTGFALATWYPVSHRLSVVFEPYGYTTLNQASLGFASGMIGFNYKVQPRFYLDTGIDFGSTDFAPRKRIFVGVTYAIANLYSWVRSF
jgi:hypothetical protein